MLRFWMSITTINTALMLGGLPACTPYVYSDSVQTLSTKMASIDSSYQTGNQKILAEKH